MAAPPDPQPLPAAGPPPDPRAAAEHAARASFGRLVSWLAWQWRDLAAAEDALADALLKALQVWPVQGVPQSPDAWLLAVARRQLLQAARHDRVRCDPAVTVLLGQDDEAAAETPPDIPDARLRLMFVCAHPAIDEAVRMPLMLQAVLGLQAAEIAPAMLLSPAALGQRLVRAKQKIRDAGVPFVEPEARELPQRVQHVLECIYGAFGLGADAVDGAEARIADLRHEAVFLCTIVCGLLPRSAEAWGLLALMTFCQARQPARASDEGDFVPLAQQDVRRWDRAAIVQADGWLWTAAQLRQAGPFQLEAAVQSAHCHRLFTGSTPWAAIAGLYAQINRHFPTIGSRVAGAVATAEAGDPAAGLAQLPLPDEELRLLDFQPLWAARAHVLALLGRTAEADAALRTAIGLSSRPDVRRWLEERRRQLPA